MNAIKTYSDTFIYNAGADENGSMERSVINFIRTSDRINIDSTSFEQIKNQVKVRQTSAVLYRILTNKDVVLCINKVEAPASFKVFMAKDLLSTNKERKVFIDVTGLLKLKDGMYVCKEVDKLCAYLFMAMNTLLYFNNNSRLVDNAVISKSATNCFVKLFTGVLDNLKVTNFIENRARISYIAGVYFNYSIARKDMGTARKYSASVLGVNVKDASGYDYWYNEEDLKDIESFITFLAKTFKLNGLTTSVYVVRFMQMYGKGTIFGLELLPSFLNIITNAYVGAYINSQKTIENFCGRDMVNVSVELLKLGAEIYNTGFTYTKEETRDYYANKLN